MAHQLPNVSLRKAIILENPCTKVVKPLNFDDGLPAIFSVEDTARLLNEAQFINPLIAKYLVIGIFAEMKILQEAKSINSHSLP